MEKEIFNAQIVNTQFGLADNDVLTFVLELKFDNGSCRFGGVPLGYYENKTDPNSEYLCFNFTPKLFLEILHTVGCYCWEELKGKFVRLRTNGEDGEKRAVEAIGNIITDNWFCLEEFFSRYMNNNQVESAAEEVNQDDL